MKFKYKFEKRKYILQFWWKNKMENEPVFKSSDFLKTYKRKFNFIKYSYKNNNNVV